MNNINIGFIYLGFCLDYKNQSIIKYGYTKDPFSRISGISRELLYGKYDFLYIFELFELENILPELKKIVEKDKIFTFIIKNNHIEDIENKYNIKLSKMQDFYNKKFFPPNIEGGGTEFIYNYPDSIDLFRDILINEFTLLGINVVELSKERVKEINEFREKNYNECKKEEENNLLKLFGFNKKIKIKSKIEYIWNPRDYQTKAINGCIEILDKNNKVYLELATGGGKSYIVFKILEYYSPDIIVIFSPRKQINIQNIDEKYLGILKKKYSVLNVSEKNKIQINKFLKKKEPKIIVSCSQSCKKLYECFNESIINYSNINIITWFDEAHYGIENWIVDNDNLEKYKNCNYKKFWLSDTINDEKINKRIFVSASPNKKLIELIENYKYFGELYTPISVNKLIKQKWLCPIIPYIFSLNKTKDEVNILKYIFNDFKKEKRKWGFSFHSKQNNAFSLFYYHFIEFKEGRIDINPYLLVGNDFYELLDKIIKNFQDLIKIKDLSHILVKNKGGDFLKLINKNEIEILEILNYLPKLKKQGNVQILDYNIYLRDRNLKIGDLLDKNNIEDDLKELLLLSQKYIEVEDYFKTNNIKYKDIKDYEENYNSIGYVVQRFSMGYDFKNIDYIVFSDKKTAFKDIIQCIGRGTRPDKLDKDINGIDTGKNKEKELKFYLPVFYDDENKDYDFKNVIEVLRYLLLDLELDINSIYNTLDKHGKKKFKFSVDGNEEIESKIIDLLYHNKILRPMNLKRLNEFCIKNNIKSEIDYNKFKEDRKLRLKNNIYDYTGFYWKKVIDPEGKIYYDTIKECINAKKNIFKDIENLNEEEYDIFYENYDDNGWLELIKYNKKIPPYRDLEKYYPK